MFQCPTNKIDVDRHDYTEDDVGMAVRETKRFLTTGALLPIMVRRMRNGRYKVQTNFITYLVAHTLSLPTVPCQEIESNGTDDPD